MRLVILTIFVYVPCRGDRLTSMRCGCCQICGVKGRNNTPITRAQHAHTESADGERDDAQHASACMGSRYRPASSVPTLRLRPVPVDMGWATVRLAKSARHASAARPKHVASCSSVRTPARWLSRRNASTALLLQVSTMLCCSPLPKPYTCCIASVLTVPLVVQQRIYLRMQLKTLLKIEVRNRTSSSRRGDQYSHRLKRTCFRK